MKALSFRCLGCLYYIGGFKWVVSPCIYCEVLGGPHPPISLKRILDDRNDDKNRR